MLQLGSAFRQVEAEQVFKRVEPPPEILHVCVVVQVEVVEVVRSDSWPLPRKHGFVAFLGFHLVPKLHNFFVIVITTRTLSFRGFKD